MSVRPLHARRTAVIASTILALSGLAACGGGGSGSGGGGACQDGKVKIGALLPLSGPAAAFGVGLRQTIEFAAGEVNDAGGIAVGDEKCKVEIVDYDTKGTAEQASTGINKLISQGTKLIWGPNLSQEVTAVQQIAVRNKVLLMQASFSQQGLSKDMPLVFATSTTPSGFSGPMVKWFTETYPDVKKVTVVIPDNQGGKDTAKINDEEYQKAGIDATVSTFAEGTSDFAPFIDRLLRDDPGAVDLASTPPGDAGVIIKQLRQAGFDGPVGRIGGEATSAIVKALGGDPKALGDFFYYAAINTEKPSVQEYFKTFEEKYGEEPLAVSAQVLPGARLMLKAIDEADSLDPTKVAKALEKLPIDDPTQGKGVWGGKEFYGINHEIIVGFYGGRYQNGELTLTPITATTE